MRRPGLVYWKNRRIQKDKESEAWSACVLKINILFLAAACGSVLAGAASWRLRPFSCYWMGVTSGAAGKITSPAKASMPVPPFMAMSCRVFIFLGCMCMYTRPLALFSIGTISSCRRVCRLCGPAYLRLLERFSVSGNHACRFNSGARTMLDYPLLKDGSSIPRPTALLQSNTMMFLCLLRCVPRN